MRWRVGLPLALLALLCAHLGPGKAAGQFRLPPAPTKTPTPAPSRVAVPVRPTPLTQLPPLRLPQAERLPSGYRAATVAQAHLDTGRKIYGFSGASINARGKVAYVVRYDDTDPGNRVIMLFDGLGSRTIAVGSSSLPIYDSSSTHQNARGDVVFTTWATGAASAIWVWSGNQLTRVAATAGSKYTSLGEPTVNEAGQIAFKWGTPMSAATKPNGGLAVWTAGSTQELLDENTPPLSGDRFIGDCVFGDDFTLFFWTARKSDWTEKALFKRVSRSEGTRITQLATDGQIPLPHQVRPLAADAAGNLYVPVDLDKTKPGDEGSYRRTPDGAWGPFLVKDTNCYSVAFPQIARNGMCGFWGMCYCAGCPSAVAQLESVYVLKAGVRTQVLKVGQSLTGRTVKGLRLHGVNDAGAMVVEATFEQSGQYTTLFRLDPR